MKITRIEIENYQQFKNFSIDLTYPKGHQKEGKPLEKICFIGQSGTGKTTLIEEIQLLIEEFDDFVAEKYKFKDFATTKDETLIINAPLNEDDKNDKNLKIYFDKNDFTDAEKVKLKDIINHYDDTDKLLLYFDESISTYYDAIKPFYPEQVFVTKKDIENKQKAIREIIEKYDNEKFLSSDFIFVGKESPKFWTYLLKNTFIHDRNLAKENAKFAASAKKDNIEQILKEYEQWKKANPNPKEKFAEQINYFFKKFFIKIDTRYPEDGEIKIVRLDNSEVPFESASTGTKRIMLTTLPLFFLNLKNTIILFDEVENSLFPDVQRELISYYTKLAPEAQFFFATHSPIIATQFEPCERFILKFDENGFVKAVRSDSPEGATLDNLLLKDFGLGTILTEKGQEMWDEFIETKRKIVFEKNEERKVELINKYLKIGTDYNFAIYEKNNEKLQFGSCKTKIS